MAEINNLPAPAPAVKGMNLTPVYVILGAGALYLAYNEYKKWKEQRDKESALTKDQASTINTEKKKPLYNLNGKPISSANLGTIAADLYSALNTSWYSPTDTERAVRTFKNNTPYGYVQQLEKLYLEKYGQNLKERMAEKLSDVEFINVKYYFK